MKLKNFLIVVDDIEKSKKFYNDIFGLKVVVDFGGNVVLTEGLALQERKVWNRLIEKESVKGDSDAELYFEENNMDVFLKKLDDYPEKIKFLSQIKEHEWGQRVVRIYDPDGHVIEVGESMEYVVKRFYSGGMTAEETAKKTQMPLDVVKKICRDFIIRRERPEDYRETENLTREAFWNVYRPGCTEHWILHRFREDEDFIPELDFVMELEGRIIGHIMYARGLIKADNGTRIQALTFGPVSIAPEYQRKGYGKKLVDYSIEKAGELGAEIICIEGNIGFYGKSGFVPAYEKGIYCDGASRHEKNPYFLVKELKTGILENITGVYCTPKGYMTDERDVEIFDITFPEKEKLKLPGQIF